MTLAVRGPACPWGRFPRRPACPVPRAVTQDSPYGLWGLWWRCRPLGLARTDGSHRGRAAETGWLRLRPRRPGTRPALLQPEPQPQGPADTPLS